MPFLDRGQSPYSAPSIVIGGSDTNLDGAQCTVITNSAVMSIGDMVASVIANSRGHARRYTTAGDAIIGVCVGFGRRSGATVAYDAGTNDTVTVAADNETIAQIFAYIDVTPKKVWSGAMQATQTIHTTQRAYFGTLYDPGTAASSEFINETSATRTNTDGRGLACVGVDRMDTTRALVVIMESALHPGTI